MSADVLLPLALEVAVPLRIAELRLLADADFADLFRTEVLDEMVKPITEQGDALLFRVRTKGQTAAVFVRTVDAIALLAFCPGGITIFGRTWTAQRPGASAC